jgi:hypothetical protein
MDTYKIKLTLKAKNDYKRIIRYIKFNLNEPKIATKLLHIKNIIYNKFIKCL